MSEGPPTGQGFGLGEIPFEGPDPLEDAPEPEASEATLEPEAPEPEGPPETPEVEAPEGEQPEPEAAEAEQPAPEAEVETEGPPEGEQPPAPEVNWQDRYSALRDRQRKTAEERNRAVEYAQQVEASLRELMASRQQSNGQQPDFEDDPARATEAIVAARLAEERQRWQAEQQTAEVRQAAQSALTKFREAHPEIQPDSPDEDPIGEVFRDMNIFEDGGLVRTDEGIFEDAYAVSKDPNLQEVLRATPELWDTPEGMKIARAQATLLASPQATTQRAPEPKAPPRRPAPAHVETGGAGTTPKKGEASTLDEFDEVISDHRRHQASPLFGGSR